MNNKETLEEVAERLTKDFPHYSVRGNMDDSDIKGWFLEALQKGAKWQAERMYSEEDLREAFRQGEQNISYSEIYGLDSKLTEQEWFEKFKKK